MPLRDSIFSYSFHVFFCSISHIIMKVIFVLKVGIFFTQFEYIFVVGIFCQMTRVWIIQTLGKQWNTRVIIVPALTRVLTGPYRFLNHPNYVVVATEMVALPLVFGAWRTAIVFTVLNAWMMIVRIGVENHALAKLKNDE